MKTASAISGTGWAADAPAPTSWRSCAIAGSARYGVLALLLALGLQAAFLVHLQNYAGSFAVAAALIGSEAVARGAIAVPLAWLKPAREDGLGTSMTDLTPAVLASGAAIGAVIALLVVGSNAVALIVGAAVGSAFVALLARHFLGGFTGDVLGAAAATARIAALGALTLAVTP